MTHILQLINILASQATATDRQMMQTAYAKERWQ